MRVNKMFERGDNMKRIEKCLEPIKDQMIRLSKVGDNSFEKAISILIKIMDWPYEKAWLRDYINILNEITEYKRDLIVLTDDIEESKTLIKELFKAVKNEDFNFFYLPTDNICRIKDEFFIRGKKLRTLFLKALEKLENSNKNLWKTQFELYNKSEAAKIELENKEKELKIKSDLKEKSKIALKNFKSNREIIAKFRDELDKIIKHQNEKNEWDYDYKGVEIIIRKGDLVEEHSDAIVNPANEYLMHDGGAARAIAEKAGDQFATDCHEYISKNGKLSVGNAMISAAGGTLC